MVYSNNVSVLRCFRHIICGLFASATGHQYRPKVVRTLDIPESSKLDKTIYVYLFYYKTFCLLISSLLKGNSGNAKPMMTNDNNDDADVDIVQNDLIIQRSTCIVLPMAAPQVVIRLVCE